MTSALGHGPLTERAQATLPQAAHASSEVGSDDDEGRHPDGAGVVWSIGLVALCAFITVIGNAIAAYLRSLP